MPLTIQQNSFKTLLTVASTPTTSNGTFTMPYADTYSLCLNVTTATAGTMDVGLETSFDNGTTYVKLPLRYTQVATTVGAFWITFKNGLGGNEIATESGLVAATGGSLAKNCVFNPNFMRVTYTIATGPDAFTLIGFFKGIQSGPQGST